MNITSLTELFSAEEIDKRIDVLARAINRDYEGKDLIMLCVLKGAFIFFSDLVRRITVGPQLDFIRLASYGASDSSSGVIAFTKEADLPLRDRHVLVVEDVVDTGCTMAFLHGQLRAQMVKSLRIAALVDKIERRKVEVKVDYAGFTVREGFIVGYGLDYAERFRELPAIYVASLGK